MSLLTKLKHPWWSGIVFVLILGVWATFPPGLIRVTLLIAAVVAATGTFYLTEYGGRNVKKTILSGILFSSVALAIFTIGKFLDARGKVTPVQASGGEQQTNSQTGPIEQKSSGPNSPNIVGNGNRVTINVNAPASLPQPTFQEESDHILFSMGEHGITAGQTIERLKKGPFAPFIWDGYSPVTLFIKGGTLLYDFKIWGGSGKPPIEVKNNKFTVQVPDWDRNFNANAFEVVNAENVPIFQLIRKTPTHIIVNGIFPLPDGSVNVAGPDGMRVGLLSVPHDFVLRPIFKYPSWKYPGQPTD